MVTKNDLPDGHKMFNNVMEIILLVKKKEGGIVSKEKGYHCE